MTATSVVVGVGLVTSAVPFVASMAPSKKARALGAPVKVQLQAIQPGELETVEWRGKPVFLLRRSQHMIDSLARQKELLADPSSKRPNEPEYARNTLRSAKSEFRILVGVCTHLGCIPSFRPTPSSPDLGASWPGGIYGPCRGSKFDFARRVFKNVPTPTNLDVPSYQFTSDSGVLIGVDPKA